ncbi:MAG: hypothetical protein ACI83D_000162 [Planctomycetota bacterium]|jgi:hypothetical protein
MASKTFNSPNQAMKSDTDKQDQSHHWPLAPVLGIVGEATAFYIKEQF